MGGEHYIGFHGTCCKNIHTCSSYKQVNITQEELDKWPSVKQHILNYIQYCLRLDKQCENEFWNLHNKISNIKYVDTFEIWWSRLDCPNSYGIAMHDISQYIINQYPNKICGHFERCPYMFEYSSGGDIEYSTITYTSWKDTYEFSTQYNNYLSLI